ncbi:MAG: TolC family protein [Gemmataceae bacterium]
MNRLPRLLGGLVLPGLLSVCARGADAPPSHLTPPPLSAGSAGVLPAGPHATTPTPIRLEPLSLSKAQQLALERSSHVRAAGASLTAAVVRRDAINSLRVPTFVARDLPVRKQQSDLGVSVAQANLHLAQMNIKYAVTYSYLTYLYAKEQEQVARDGIAGLTELRTKLLTPVDGDSKELLNPDELTGLKRRNFLYVEIFLRTAQTRQQEAEVGAERALSALREALGLCPDAPLLLSRARLPHVDLHLDKRILLDLACSRRPEILQASLGVEVAGLETEAQAKASLLAFRMNTFASASDIHAHPLPEGRYDLEYRPGAVGPEYPTTLNGHRKNRVEQAEAWQDRAGSVVERTKALIALETDQAYLRWVEASKKLQGYQRAYRAAVARVEEIRPDVADAELFATSLTTLLDAGSLASQLRVELNKARYEMLLGLAQLERVTAGGFCARLDAAPDAPDEAALAIQAAKEIINKRPKAKDDGAANLPNLELQP